MANFWEQDDIVQPAGAPSGAPVAPQATGPSGLKPTAQIGSATTPPTGPASPNFWEQDDVIKPAPSKEMGLVPAEDGSQIEVPLSEATRPTPAAPAPVANDAAIPQSPDERQELSQREDRAGVADLPPVTPELFQGLPREQQGALREAYARHPKSTRDDYGNIVYNGQKVPNLEAPELTGADFLEGPKGVAETAGTLGKGVLKGTANLGSNVIETGLAGVDVAKEKVTGEDSNLAEGFRKAVPTLKADDDSAVEQFVIDTTEMGLGAAAGGGAAKAASTFFQLGKLAKAGSVFLGSNVGSGVGQNAANKTMITGEESALYDLVPALGTDKSGSYSENVLRKRIDLINDSIVSSAIIGAAGKAASVPAGWLWNKTLGNIFDFTSLDARQKKLTLELLDLGAGVDPEAGMTPAQIAKARQIYLDALDAESTFAAQSGNVDLGDVKVNRSTARAAAEGGASPSSNTQLQDFEGAMRARSRGPIDQADAQLGDRLNEGMDKVITREAGEREANVEVARQTVVDEAENVAKPYRENVASADQAVVGAKEDYASRIENDPVFGGRVKKIMNDGKASTELGRRGDLEDLTVEGLSAKRQAEDAELRRLTQEIPEGLRQNNPADVIQQMNDIPELPDTVVSKIKGAAFEGGDLEGLDYRKLADALQPLSQEINRQIRLNSNPDLVDKLIKLRETINLGAPDAAEIAARKNYYETVWAPHWKDGLMDDFADLEKGTKNRPIDREAGSRKIVQQGLNEPAQTKHIRDILDTSTGPKGNQAYLVDQVMMNDVVDEIATHTLQGKPLTDIGPEQLTRGLKDRIQQIKKTNPEMANRIDDLFDALREGRTNIDELETTAKTIRQETQKREKEIFTEEFKNFFEGSDYKPKEGANQIFDDLIKGGESNQLSRVVRHINESGSPEARAGMRGAYIKYLKDNLFDIKKQDKAATPFNRPAVNAGKMSEFTKDSPTYKAGEVIFADEPQALEYIQQVAEEISKNKKAALNTGEGFGAADKATRGGVEKAKNLLVTWTLGVLNPTATKARSISSSVLDSMDPADKVAKFAEEIMADSTKFSEMAKKYMGKEMKVLTPEMKMYLRRSMIKAGVLAPTDEDNTFGPMQDAAEEGRYKAEDAKPSPFENKPKVNPDKMEVQSGSAL